MTQRIWVAWEDHRRSKTLSSEFGCEYIPIVSKGNRALRYPVLCIKTIFLIIRKRPRFLFCQNPSVVLSALCAALKPFFGYKLIVDRHSNFKFETRGSRLPKWVVFHKLSDYSVKRSDLNIVTNNHLKRFVVEVGGRATVLPDKIPRIKKSKCEPNLFQFDKNEKVVCITTFDEDEPISELVDAAFLVKNRASLYFTGNYRKIYKEKEKHDLRSMGVIFCGFVDDESYLDILNGADLVVVLTKKDYILNCGAYEALAAGKPLVLSNTPTLKNYFGSGPTYTDPTSSKEIAHSIIKSLDHKIEIELNIAICRQRLSNLWDLQFKNVLYEIFNS